MVCGTLPNAQILAAVWPQGAVENINRWIPIRAVVWVVIQLTSDPGAGVSYWDVREFAGEWNSFAIVVSVHSPRQTHLAVIVQARDALRFALRFR